LPLVSNSSNYSISAVLNGFYSKPPQRVEQFLQDIPIAGHYVTRKNYNKNEYRFGDRRAEILDYLVMSNGIYDPINVQTGQWLDIYIKVGFHHPIAELRLGFLIKTVDGIPIYGTNTQYARQIVEPVRFPGIKVYKWSVKMEVAPGDIFLDLGIDEAKGIDIITLDKRCDFIHLIAETEEQFTGFSKLDMTFEEIVSSPDRL